MEKRSEEKCSICGGSGFVDVEPEVTCPKCLGWGGFEGSVDIGTPSSYVDFVECHECKNTGKVKDKELCTACKGTGLSIKKER